MRLLRATTLLVFKLLACLIYIDGPEKMVRHFLAVARVSGCDLET